jgi:hypothetical protein
MKAGGRDQANARSAPLTKVAQLEHGASIGLTKHQDLNHQSPHRNLRGGCGNTAAAPTHSQRVSAGSAVAITYVGWFQVVVHDSLSVQKDKARQHVVCDGEHRLRS